MTVTVGIRREDKNKWERRVPLTPDAVHRLVDGGIPVVVQPSKLRIFTDDEYRRAGALLSDDLSSCALVLAVKEIPTELIHPQTAYVFFSHTMKGQVHNMPLLQHVIDVDATLIDYEPVVDPSGSRLVHFGRFAGIAGTIDGLWALGRRLQADGSHTPLLDISPAWRYSDLQDAKDAVSGVGERIRTEGFPDGVLAIGVVGDGNVARGAHEVLDALGAVSVAPDHLRDPALHGPGPEAIIRATFRESDTVARSDGGPFDLADYRAHPSDYQSVFAQYLPDLSMIVNAIYWDEHAPRLVSRDDLRQRLTPGSRLRVIADLSCDIDGGIQATVRATTPDNPVFVYDPHTGTAEDGVVGPGVVVLAVDHLPCELPKDASISFSDSLEPWIAELAGIDYSAPVTELKMPEEWRRAVIAHRGHLAPDHQHLSVGLHGHG